jgi:hypothetical protein
VEKVWKNPETCMKMGEKARKLMEDRMNKKHQFDEFLQFFHNLSGE